MIYPASFLAYCASVNYRLTSLRKRILFILWHVDKPLKAYEILEQLILIKNNSQPSTVYRVLDYFVSCGIVHKIESIQSYTLCCEPEKQLPSEILMVCNRCHQIQEIYDLQLHLLVKKISAEHNFYIGQDIIELKGFCGACQVL